LQFLDFQQNALCDRPGMETEKPAFAQTGPQTIVLQPVPNAAFRPAVMPGVD